MRATRHERRAAPRQVAAYNACPYHFRIHYSHRWNGGFGTGFLDWGQDHPVFDDEDQAAFAEKVALITTANVQSAGMPFDPATLTVEITGVVLRDDHNAKEQ